MIGVLEGEIVPGDADRFRLIARQHNLSGLVVRSPGGAINEALELGRFISSLRLPVQAQDMCASACPLILLSSPQRSITAGTRIGFHSAATRDDEATSTTVSLARIYAELGVPNDVLGGLVTHRPQEMYWVNTNQIKNMNIATSAPMFSRSKDKIISPEKISYFFDQHFLIIITLLLLVVCLVGWMLIQIRGGVKSHRQSSSALLTTSPKSAVPSFIKGRSFGPPASSQPGRAQSVNGGAPQGSCPNCRRSLPGGHFRSCPACGYDLKPRPHASATGAGLRP